MSFFKKIFSKKNEEKKETQPRRRSGLDRTKSPSMKPSVKGDMIIREARIEDFSAPDKINKDEILKVNVQGHFSDLGWKLDNSYGEVKQNKIVLFVIGKKKKGMMSAQAMKAFSTEIEIKELKKGKYTLIANKGTSKTIQVEVK